MTPEVSPQSAVSGTWYDVRDFGAKGNGVADDSAAIDAADRRAVHSDQLGVDGVTVVANGGVYFPAGTYRCDHSLAYRGAPWRGDGRNASIIDYRGNAQAVDAVGSQARRRVLRIVDLAVHGAHAAAGTVGLRLGHNYRSFGALERVEVRDFPSSGIFFAADNWILSFQDIYVQNCGREGGAGVALGPAAGDVNALDWFNLVCEGCGKAGSGLGGGLHLEGHKRVRHWKFYGGCWEGNAGAAEAKFVACYEIVLLGVYAESFANQVQDSIVFSDSSFVSVGGYAMVDARTSGKAIRAMGTSQGTVGGGWISERFAAAVSVEGESRVAVQGPLGDAPMVASGSGILVNAAQTPRGVQELTFAKTVAIDARMASHFTLRATDGRALTIAAPVLPLMGQRIVLEIANGSAGAMGALSWDPVYLLAGPLRTPSPGARQVIEFSFNGATWVEVGRSARELPGG